MEFHCLDKFLIHSFFHLSIYLLSLNRGLHEVNEQQISTPVHLPTVKFINTLFSALYPVRLHILTNFSVRWIITFGKKRLEGTASQCCKLESRGRIRKLK